MQFKDIKVGETYAYRDIRGGEGEVKSIQVTAKTQVIFGEGGGSSRRAVDGFTFVGDKRVIVADLSDEKLLGVASAYAVLIEEKQARQEARDLLGRRQFDARMAFAKLLESQGHTVEWRVSASEGSAARKEGREPLRTPAGYGSDVHVNIPDWPEK